MDKSKEPKVPLTFNFVIIYEVVAGTLEATVGIGLVIFQEELQELYQYLRDLGLLGNYHNLLASLFDKTVPYLVNHHLLIGLFLTIIGLTKIICGIGLFYQKKWADNLLIGLLLVFLPPDIIGLLQHPSELKSLFLITNILIIFYLSRNKIVKHMIHKQ